MGAFGSRSADPSSVRQKTATTSRLEIACEVAGPVNGPPIVLLHGWPDDPRTWDEMGVFLHEAGFRTIAPYLRGFGPTRFRSATTMRSGQLSALGQDVLECLDALDIRRCTIIGHDWGAAIA